MSESAAAISAVPVHAVSDLDRLKRLVLADISSPNSRRAYGKALEDFLAWYRAEPRGRFRSSLCRSTGRACLRNERDFLDDLCQTRSLVQEYLNQRVSCLRRCERARRNGEPEFWARFEFLDRTHALPPATAVVSREYTSPG